MAEGKHDNTAGVRKYFFFIKENVSSDWKDLAFQLDFRRSDIDNISGRNRDDKSRCMDLLEEWVKYNGEKATVEVLMGALSQANLQSTVDGLKNKYPELSQASSSQQEMKALPRLPALEKLSLSNISVGPEGFKVVMQAAEEHPKLDELSYWPRDPFPEEVYTSDTCLTFM